MPHRKSIALATSQRIYETNRVRGALDALAPGASEALRKTYERMIAAGPDRFCVKPSGAAQMSELYEAMPNFRAALDEIGRQVALAASSSDPLEIAPMLLLGEPGVGKTHFGKSIAATLSTGFAFCPMSSMTAGWILSGASSQWKSAKPGKVFQALVHGEYANPVMLVDEIDKAGGDGQYDPLGALYELLEGETAREFVDEFAEVPVDASRVVWICTANDESMVPGPLLSRMSVFWIDRPDAEGSRAIARALYRATRSEKEWGARFEPELSEATLERLAKSPPREMKKALARAFGLAHLAGRRAIEPADVLLDERQGRRGIGF